MTLQQSPGVTVIAKNEYQDIGDFAVAIEQTETIPSRAVVMTSAGRVSSCDDSGRDLYAEASNETWTVNAIKWLEKNLTE
jgi:hypothetical protein